jgi:hypothetical protein
MSAVTEGIMPDKAWKLERHKADWRIGDTINASIGQGYVLSSPLQLAVMTARIASGRAVEPRLVRMVNDQEVPVPEAPPLALTPEYLAAVQRAMHEVVNGERGTAKSSRIVEPTMVMAGKTGTSQVRNISAAEREAGVISNDDLPWDRRDHALFVGYAPADAPRYAIAVVVEHGGGGSTAAAPIARDIILRAMSDGLPSLEAYPSSQRGRIETMLKELPLRDPVTGLVPARPKPDGGGAMSFLEYRVKQAPTGLRKVLYMNWPLVVLVTAVASVGFLMLYSIAGGEFDTWARRRWSGLRVGMVLMFIVAMVPIWFWRNMAGVAYLVAFILLLVVEFFGEVGMGAQRWIDLGFIRLQPSEMMKFTPRDDAGRLLRLAGPQEGIAPAVCADPGPADRRAHGAGPAAAEPWHLADADSGRAAVMFAAGVSLWYFAAVAALGVGAIAGCSCRAARPGSSCTITSIPGSTPS